MQTHMVVILSVLATFIVLEIIFTGFFKKRGQSTSDAVVEIISTLTLILLSQPLALLGGGLIAAAIAPGAAGSLAHLPLLAGVGIFLICDDMVQYWWHRASHTFPWLYNLHRPHHNAPYLSIRVVYRNNLFYYLFMPNLWISGALIYLGLGWVYVGYVVVKMTVIYAAHSDVRWDEPLYKIKWLSPPMWVVERLISTPATHSAHHGKYASDGITNYKGNYGNLLFLWDVIFGTAKITRRYPEEFGVENLPETSISEQLIWPIAHTKIGKKPVKVAAEQRI
ncbi:sterol desaturase family protein [Hyphococcus sp.]|uniref:sterol desaturase family protein n=1 Tax=Hyphococcus sp. TaxID=2038636 RepID=UPI003CCBFC95